MEIRRLQGSDYALLASAIQALIPEEERDGGVASAAHLKRALENTACYFIVCLLDSNPVGYLSAFGFPAIDNDCSQVYLYDIVVDEQHRRKGIGSRMIEELKGQCKQDGADHIWVGTSLDNEPAQKTFEGTGAERERETYIEYIYSLDEDDQQIAEAGCNYTGP
ncbi:MAG TPA: GNAT family N-acetyltransferase [Chloroflexia bacterium]|jgi:ribosomal protein S18 acetylase RimI-like enzyme